MFIAIEGCEGSGKSSLSQLLKEKFIAEGKSVLATREPGGSRLGEQIRDWVLTPSTPSLSPYTDLFLLLAARSQHIKEKIQPAITAGDIVICDRFHDSTIVYQGIAEGLGKEYVENLCHHVVGTTKFIPDITCLIDIPVEIGLSRKQKQKVLDKFEEKSLEYHAVIRKGFLLLAKENPERYVVIDGTQPLELSLNQVMEAYNRFSCKTKTT